jgi:hypothetical protein
MEYIMNSTHKCPTYHKHIFLKSEGWKVCMSFIEMLHAHTFKKIMQQVLRENGCEMSVKRSVNNHNFLLILNIALPEGGGGNENYHILLPLFISLL